MYHNENDDCCDCDGCKQDIARWRDELCAMVYDYLCAWAEVRRLPLRQPGAARGSHGEA